MARPGNYLHRRGKSGIWHVRFQYPALIAEKLGKREEEISLKTTNRLEAELRAMPHITQHKMLLMALPRIIAGDMGEPKPRYEPGREHFTDDGQRIIATKETLLFMAEDGSIARTEPNTTTVNLTFKGPEVREWQAVRPKATRKAEATLEEQIIASWIVQRKPNKHIEREARKGWDLWREVVEGKSIRLCTRDDGRKLVSALQAQGMKAATIGKYLSHLNSATNMAIGDGKLKFNPFSGVAPKVDDELEREPYTDAHMKIMRDALASLEADERRLWVLLATTGMRRGEAFEIDREYEEPVEGSDKGIRYVVVGTKNLASKRRVPLPRAYLDMYPEPITGPLFPDTPNNTSRRLLRRTRALGITDPKYVVHSLRHRAKDRLRAFMCPHDIQLWALGHDLVSASDGYGKGPPVALLKEWMDKIGF